MARLFSVYAFVCLCGLKIESHHRELVCPNCSRQIAVNWGAEYAVQQKEESNARTYRVKQTAA